MPTPEMSVVVVAGNQRARVAGCVESVLAQDGVERLEILIVDCGHGGSAEPWAGLPGVRSIRPAPGSHYGEALAAGVFAAQSPLIAFLEEHARAHPGWALALLEAHREPMAAVACEVHNGNPGLGWSDGWGLMGYGKWYAPLPPGETEFLHGYNSTCKRDVLLAYGDRLAGLLLADTVFALRLARDGHRLVNAPAARIDHLNERELWQPLVKNFLAQRFSTSMRAEECDWSAWRRWAYVFGSPLLPVYGLWHQGRALWQRRPALLWTLMRILPQYFLTGWATAAGISIGLAFGPGRSAQHFTRLELDTDRPEVPHPSAGRFTSL
ncbi:MAG TPA: glycosyltransferase [Thermoanaerobaculia bacterium]|nr:glycosyltransferase [Thermoanaerobaculia bacterium]